MDLANSFSNVPQFHTVIPGMSLIAIGSVIGTLTTLLATSNQYKDFMTNPNPTSTESPFVFDFIVVGSGSAGGIVASRLSESGHYRVLLLEAGGDPLPMNSIPFLYQANLHKPETDWGYKTVPQKYSANGLINNTIPYPRGRSVGGSSNLNGMIYMRGCPKDFDNWANITGDSQWSYENVLPYFKKLENYDGTYKNDSSHHGRHGPIHITVPPNQALLQEWLKAGQEMGFPVKDLNAKQTASFSPLEFTVRDGFRWESYEGYIKPAIQRSNFKLIRYARVLKININERNEATGVNYLRNGQIVEVKATKEVILSAGAIGSPQLLLLSGIGPAQELISLGIKPIKDMPGVGKGLMDHPMTLVGPFLHNESVSFIPERNLTYSDALNYLINKQGPIATIPFSGIAAISTTGDSEWPNVLGYQMTSGMDSTTSRSFQSLFGLQEGTMEKYLGRLGTQDASWIAVSLGLPKSSGEVKLVSSNPLDAPAIDPNYFSDATGADLKAMVEAFKFFVYLHESTSSFRKYNTTFHNTPFPGCEQFYGDRDKDFECRIRQWTYTSFDPSSTCRMGKHDDPNAVVDSLLRVRGVRKLRIADASVMPQITNANLNVPTMMIAEKAADLILHDWCTPANPEDPDAEGPLYILDRISPLRHLSDKIFNISTINRIPPVKIPCPAPPAT